MWEPPPPPRVLLPYVHPSYVYSTAGFYFHMCTPHMSIPPAGFYFHICTPHMSIPLPGSTSIYAPLICLFHCFICKIFPIPFHFTPLSAYWYCYFTGKAFREQKIEEGHAYEQLHIQRDLDQLKFAHNGMCVICSGVPWLYCTASNALTWVTMIRGGSRMF